MPFWFYEWYYNSSKLQVKSSKTVISTEIKQNGEILRILGSSNLFLNIYLMKKQIKYEIKNFLDLNLDNFISNHIFQDEQNVDDLLKWLQKKFNLKNYPYKIVCLDISHTSWNFPSWWLSAMLWWIINKKHFRQFKIPKELWWNDYDSLKYCIIKYFQNNQADLFIIDGWKWQLNIIDDLPNDIVLNVDFMSIWKWKARKRAWKLSWKSEVFFQKDKETIVDYWKFEDKLLLKLRDHSHDFANRYRKKQESINIKTNK